ncbi:MAG: glutathione S-transferase family protein [Alphaproteobacteria bacterium]|jgi:glutathione S-transferase|nr:glutathione S-transferase family protein [Alphaproteobacteria bacterium]MBT7943346.1 glutathione S-transferase family protein [Alphaproteobacteria bacterium]
MADFTAVLGDYNTSSWSMRGWLALKHSGASFDTVMVSFRDPDVKSHILAHSPSGLVPLLKHHTQDGDMLVWDSLAIIEFLNEMYPDAGLWPKDQAARAHARVVSAEMHSGFAPLRNHMPMNLRDTKHGEGMGDGVADNIARICAIWEDCRERFGQQSGGGGDFLFGTFTGADIMFAPVVTRFQTYGVDLSPVCRAYCEAVRATPAMQEWTAGA